MYARMFANTHTHKQMYAGVTMCESISYTIKEIIIIIIIIIDYYLEVFTLYKIFKILYLKQTMFLGYLILKFSYGCNIRYM
jgi:hypothetical protein